MIDNAKSQITSILGRAEEISSMFVTDSIIITNETDNVQNTREDKLHIDDNMLKIDLGNGQTGRVNISEMD